MKIGTGVVGRFNRTFDSHWLPWCAMSLRVPLAGDARLSRGLMRPKWGITDAWDSCWIDRSCLDVSAILDGQMRAA
jgi:hypothetical protein